MVDIYVLTKLYGDFSLSKITIKVIPSSACLFISKIKIKSSLEKVSKLKTIKKNNKDLEKQC